MRTHPLARASMLSFCLVAAPTAVWSQIADSVSQAGAGRVHVAATDGYGIKIPAGAARFTLDSTDLMASGAENFSAVLQARVPGLSVLRSGGSAAKGSRVQLRGPHSMLMATDPIIVVDGLRVNAMQESSIIDVGVRTSRLDDIALEDVARVDVLPGPAAASLFGPGAAGGALVITTKRAHTTSLRWRSRIDSRFGIKPSGFPANHQRRGIATATGQPTTDCDLLAVASGACTPTGLDVWNPLEQASPFRRTKTGGGSFSISGGIEQTLARLSATGHRTTGLTGDDDEGRLGVRGNVSHRVSNVLDFGVAGGYSRSSAGLPWSGNNSAGIINSALFGAAVDDATHGYRTAYAGSDTRQQSTHWLAGATVEWRPMPCSRRRLCMAATSCISMTGSTAASSRLRSQHRCSCTELT